MDKTEKNEKELAKVSEALEAYISKGDDVVDDVSSSRGESAPQAFRKSIAEMEEEVQHATVSAKEMKALKRSRYDKIAEKFQFAYVLRNKKNGLVVEIRAASSTHACNIVGWRPRHVEVIEVIDTKKETPSKVANPIEVV